MSKKKLNETIKTLEKLTGKKVILKEIELPDWMSFPDGTSGSLVGEVDGYKIYALEDSSSMDTMFYKIQKNGRTASVNIDVAGEKVTVEYVKSEIGNLPDSIAAFITQDINSELD